MAITFLIRNGIGRSNQGWPVAVGSALQQGRAEPCFAGPDRPQSGLGRVHDLCGPAKYLATEPQGLCAALQPSYLAGNGRCSPAGAEPGMGDRAAWQVVDERCGHRRLFLTGFCDHWPTDAPLIYVDFVREGGVGKGAARNWERAWAIRPKRQSALPNPSFISMCKDTSRPTLRTAGRVLIVCRPGRKGSTNSGDVAMNLHMVRRQEGEGDTHQNQGLQLLSGQDCSKRHSLDASQLSSLRN